MMLVRTYLAQSEIQGLGVFSGEFIPRGAQVWVLNPKFDVFVHPNEIEALPAHMQDFVARYSYPHLELPGIRIIDCDDGKFMNHTDRPNTDFRIFDRGYALEDIAPGTELTCSYYEFDPEFRGFDAPEVLAPKTLEIAIATLQTPKIRKGARRIRNHLA